MRQFCQYSFTFIVESFGVIQNSLISDWTKCGIKIVKIGVNKFQRNCFNSQNFTNLLVRFSVRSKTPSHIKDILKKQRVALSTLVVSKMMNFISATSKPFSKQQ